MNFRGCRLLKNIHNGDQRFGFGVGLSVSFRLVPRSLHHHRHDRLHQSSLGAPVIQTHRDRV